MSVYIGIQRHRARMASSRIENWGAVVEKRDGVIVRVRVPANPSDPFASTPLIEGEGHAESKNDSPANPAKWAESIARISTIERLDLSLTGFEDDALLQLGKSSRLSVLDLSSTRISNRGLRAIRNYPALRWLSLSGTFIDDGGLFHLSELVNLEHLDLSSTMVRGNGLSKLESLSNLRTLVLRKGLHLDENKYGSGHLSLGTLPAFPELHSLDVSVSTMDRRSWSRIAALPLLRKLDASHTNIADQWMDSDRPLPVAELKVNCTELTGLGFKSIAKWPKLETLEMRWSPEPSECVLALRGSKSLSCVRLGGCLVTPELVSALLLLPKNVSRIELEGPVPNKSLELLRERFSEGLLVLEPLRAFGTPIH